MGVPAQFSNELDVVLSHISHVVRREFAMT